MFEIFNQVGQFCKGALDVFNFTTPEKQIAIAFFLLLVSGIYSIICIVKAINEYK